MHLAMKQSLLCTLMLALTIASTGCMTSPYHGETIGSTDDNVRFGGFLLNANECVEIQALNPKSHAWETIGWSRSASRSSKWSGMDFYSWHASILVPARCWTKTFQPRYDNDDVVVAVGIADVRAVTDAGTLLTINDDFVEWFDPYHESPREMLIDHHHGTTATIFARLPY